MSAGEQLKSMLDATEGWAAQKRLSTPRYHYIRDTMALCRGIGFYHGDLVPHVTGSPRGHEDCAKCYRLIETERKTRGGSR